MARSNDRETTFHADDRRSRLIVIARADSLFQFSVDCIYGEEDAPEPEAVGCWQSDVSGGFVSGLYDDAEAALSAGRRHMIGLGRPLAGGAPGPSQGAVP